MKKIIGFIICAIVLMSICTIGVNAQPAPHFYGDVNDNREIEVTDATEIQRYEARLLELSDLSKDLADVDADGEVSVMDATMIQRKIAKLISSFNQDDYGLYTYVSFNNITADFDSEKAMVGVPVTFKIQATSIDGSPLRYAIRINGIDVVENVEPVLSYTFDDVGSYLIDIVVYNKYNEDYVYNFEYSVIDKKEDNNLIISSINQNLLYLNDNDNIIITANAYGGTAPYEYRFEMDGYSLKQDYSSNNSFAVGKLPIGIYEVRVDVKDADGNITNAIYQFEVEDIKVG